MGLTKQYLRYVPSGTFNVIASGGCNICFVVLQGQEGRFLAVGACENIIVWDLRLGEKNLVLPGNEHEVTYIAASPDNVHLAAGYSDGTISIFNILTGENITIYSGHRTAISALAFDTLGHRLASGGKDTEIVTWDMIAECGIGRLSSHKGVITSVVFMKQKNILISSSKDTYIKLWDLDVSHCFHTIAAHITEVWGLTIAGNDEYIVAGSNDSELRVWSMQEELSKTQENNLEDAAFNSGVNCVKSGSILRTGKGRVASMVTDKSGSVLSVHGVDASVEIFLFNTKEEAEIRWKKRQAKERKKATKLGVAPGMTNISLKDIVKRLPAIKSSGKVKSVDLIRGKNELRVAVSLSKNKLELYSLELTENVEEPSKLLRNITSCGHEGEVRAVAFSSDNLAIASVGSSSVKMWNRVSLACLRTVECSYALSVCFVPGDRHVLVGLKNGSLLIVDLSVGEILEEIPAHTSELWAVVLTNDKSCAVTCGGDSTVKIWRFELVPCEDSKAKVLSLLHTRTLKLDEPVLSVRVSPCGRYIAASLLDSTVKIFFMDTFKFFLSLYGHNLPVLCTDISYDSALIVTGSADRNIKIWGLDFGDCHKSIFAHDDSVTAVAFVHKTHYFFSIGKDGKIKQWDADSFNKIVTLQGHFGEGWNLAVGGEFLVTCGKDRTLRLYEKSDEPIVLSDEQEEEREKEELVTGQDSVYTLPSTKTVTAEKGAEVLLECLDLIESFEAEVKAGLKPSLPAIMIALGAKNPQDYLARCLSSIRSSELGEALLLLPLHNISSLLKLLPSLLISPTTCEIASKAMILLLKVHHGPLSTDITKLPLLEKLQRTALKSITEFRDILGLNLYGLKFIQREIEEREGLQLFSDASKQYKEKEKKKRKKEKLKQAAILSL